MTILLLHQSDAVLVASSKTAKKEAKKMKIAEQALISNSQKELVAGEIRYVRSMLLDVIRDIESNKLDRAALGVTAAKWRITTSPIFGFMCNKEVFDLCETMTGYPQFWTLLNLISDANAVDEFSEAKAAIQRGNDIDLYQHDSVAFSWYDDSGELVGINEDELRAYSYELIRNANALPPSGTKIRG